jgi:starch phosphorylase
MFRTVGGKVKKQKNHFKKAYQDKLKQSLPEMERIPHPIPPKVVVEDDRTGMDVATFKRAFQDHLNYLQGVTDWNASPYDHYMALSYVVRDRLMHRWIETGEEVLRSDAKMVFYLSAEFLMGRQLENNLFNIGCWNQVYQALAELGLDLYDIAQIEPEPGLGNGGLGRLAACFLDSIATLNLPGHGYGIRYEFGIFEQLIEDGWQVERADRWLRLGNPWEIHRPQNIVNVTFGGHTHTYRDDEGKLRSRWVPERSVMGSPVRKHLKSPVSKRQHSPG